MKKLFGTDGMRGLAGEFPLDAPTVWTVGHSLARHLATQRAGVGVPRLIVGRDTRESGAWMEAALIEGARAAGAQCESAGVITTPGVAFLARTLPADAGVVISASHNPYSDNGIKVFATDGRKLDEHTERLIEADIHARRAMNADSTPNSAAPHTDAHEPFAASDSGDSEHAATLQARYLDYLAEEVADGLRLDGLSIVVDCANGAASALAPALFTRLGAHVTARSDSPDGRNINLECGSLYVERLGGAVVEAGADLGVAFDGDADRALFVDAGGQVVDGDATLWVMANHLAARGELAGQAVVATVMSNLGLEVALKSRGIELRRADVGDKYVLEELLRAEASLGGEQSGHIIFPRLSLAGDGMLTTLLLLRALRETGQTLAELAAGFVRYPQVLVNTQVREKRPFADVPEIAEHARRTEAELGANGRLLLRYSGTEPLARVMIEGQNQNEIERMAHDLASVIRGALGGA